MRRIICILVLALVAGLCISANAQRLTVEHGLTGSVRPGYGYFSHSVTGYSVGYICQLHMPLGKKFFFKPGIDLMYQHITGEPDYYAIVHPDISNPKYPLKSHALELDVDALFGVNLFKPVYFITGPILELQAPLHHSENYSFLAHTITAHLNWGFGLGVRINRVDVRGMWQQHLTKSDFYQYELGIGSNKFSVSVTYRFGK